jgi:hypothetical protein
MHVISTIECIPYIILAMAASSNVRLQHFEATQLEFACILQKIESNFTSLSGADDSSCCGVPMYELAVQTSTDHCSKKMRLRPHPAAKMPFSPIVTMQSYAAA